jgi:hypothetical protein
LTVPLPVPLTPEVTVIHDALLTAVQPQPPPAVTVTLPDPPLEPKLCDAGVALMLHAAASVTVIVCPATVSAPLRGTVEVFGATV